MRDDYAYFLWLFRKYPLGSQRHTQNPLVLTRLFEVGGQAIWYLTEYDPVTYIAFGYVLCLDDSGWREVSLEGLFGQLASYLPAELVWDYEYPTYLRANECIFQESGYEYDER